MFPASEVIEASQVIYEDKTYNLSSEVSNIFTGKK